MKSSKTQAPNSNQNPKKQISNGADKKPFELEERTAQFGEKMIDVLKKLPRNSINQRLVPQAIGAGGRLGANYCEANEAESKRDFQHKIGICKKETKETKHWLRLLARANPEHADELRALWKEAQELLLIFSSILRSSRGNKKKEN